MPFSPTSTALTPKYFIYLSRNFLSDAHLHHALWSLLDPNWLNGTYVVGLISLVLWVRYISNSPSTPSTTLWLQPESRVIIFLAERTLSSLDRNMLELFLQQVSWAPHLQPIQEIMKGYVGKIYINVCNQQESYCMFQYLQLLQFGVEQQSIYFNALTTYPWMITL